MKNALSIITSFILIGLFSACHGSEAVTSTSITQELVRADAWALIAESDDVFLHHRPAHIDCGGSGYVVEDGILEIDTGRCTYFAASQPLRHDLSSTDTLVVTIYHDHLFSVDGGLGHIALSIDDDILWQVDIPIPAESRLFTEYVPLSHFYESGRHIAFHLHNHGVNHWRLVNLTVQ